MTEFETKVFETQTLGRRILRKKLLGRVPALPLAVLLIAAGFAAAAFYALGPAATQAVQMRQMTSGGLPVGDILYGQKTNQQPVYFNSTIASNSYTTAQANVYVVLTVTASPTAFAALADCDANVKVYQSPVPVGAYTQISAAFAGGTCTYTGTTTQNVPIGSTAQAWPFQIIYQSSGSAGPTFTWTNQLWA